MVSFLRKLLSEILQLNLFFWRILIAALVNHSHSIMRIFHCFYRYIKAFWQNIKGSPNPTILIKNRSPAEVWAKVENQKVPFPYTGARTAAKLLIWRMMNDVLFPSLKFFGGLIHTAAQSPWEQMGAKRALGSSVTTRGQGLRSGPPWASLHPLLNPDSDGEAASEFLSVHRVIPQNKLPCVIAKAKQSD